MVHTKTRWKWHECLQARDDIIDSDSECENDNYIGSTDQQDLDEEDYQTNNSIYETNSSSMAKIDEDIYTKQQELKEEVKVAFALSAKMARMRVEVEREELAKKRSSLYDLFGIDANGDKLFNIEILEEMNIGQLQSIANDLYCQIEANNDELVNLLIERDSLSMKQDSILVDIEDLTRRLHEREINEPKQCVYLLKHSQETIPKRSIFHNLFLKAYNCYSI